MTSLRYDWERDYIAAVLETDIQKLATRIAVARSVMLSRVELLNMNCDEAEVERDSLAAAFGALHKLRIERLGDRRRQQAAAPQRESLSF